MINGLCLNDGRPHFEVGWWQKAALKSSSLPRTDWTNCHWWSRLKYFNRWYNSSSPINHIPLPEIANEVIHQPCCEQSHSLSAQSICPRASSPPPSLSRWAVWIGHYFLLWEINEDRYWWHFFLHLKKMQKRYLPHEEEGKKTKM